MKKRRYKIPAVALCLLLAVSCVGYASEFSRVGSTGAQFLKIGMGARYIGLGEASTAVVNDAYSMFWNPAGMAQMAETEFAFTNVNWIQDVQLNYVSFVKPMGFGGTFGLSMTILDVGDMEETTVWEPNGTGNTFNASSFALAAGYAHNLTDRFALGFKIKYVSERISEVNARGFAFDFGTQYETGIRNLRMGLNISNLGPEMKFSGPDLNFKYRRDDSDNPNDPVNSDNSNYDPVNASYATEGYDLPLIFRLGVAYDFMRAENSVWTVAAEAKHPNDNVQQVSLGTEYSWNQTIALRAGYKFRYEEEGLSLGGGVILNPTPGTGLVIDYAWSDFGRLQSVHRFSFGIRF